MNVEVEVQSVCASAATLGETMNPSTWQDWFKTWVTHLNPSLSPIQAYTLSLRLTDDQEIQALNASYRQQDRATDVLAFAALETDGIPAEIWMEHPLELGDIVISVETAQRQAQQQGHTLQRELAWLACHGLLHLLGWDHPDLSHLEAMLAKQEALLQLVTVEDSPT